MIGEQIGNFRIVSQLGRGGMGEVYLGDHEKIGTKVAIKVLQAHISGNTDQVERFFNEARAVSKIQHSGIGKIFDVGFHRDGRAYLVMEFLAGETLAARIRRAGRMPLGAVCEVGRQICGVLEAVHKAGITHRDLKPDNIFIVPDEELPGGERVKIVDFGIAKLSGAGPGLTATGSGSMGTPAYMSPEQWKNSKAVDWRADAYSLGCLTFEMAAGRPPFIAETIGEACSLHLTEAPPRLASMVAAPATLDALVASLLAKQPEQRPAAMRDISNTFSAVVASAASMGATQLSGPAIELGATLPSTPPVPRTPLGATPPSVATQATQPTITPPHHVTTLGGSAGSQQVAVETTRKRGLIFALGGIATVLAVVVVVLLVRSSDQARSGGNVERGSEPPANGSAARAGSVSITPTVAIESGSGSGSGSAMPPASGSGSGAGSATPPASGSGLVATAGSATASAGSGSAWPPATRPPAPRPNPRVGGTSVGGTSVGGASIGGEGGVGNVGLAGLALPKHTPATREVTRPLYPRLFECGQRHDAVGTLIEWVLQVRPDGTVERVEIVNNANRALVTCVSAVFKSARFKPSQLGTRALDSIKLR